MDCSSPGSSVREISQASILEWVVIPFSRGSSRPAIKTRSPTLQADSLPLSHQGSPLYCISDTYSERQAICEMFFTTSPPQKMISNHSHLFLEKSELSLLHLSSCPLCSLQLWGLLLKQLWNYVP